MKILSGVNQVNVQFVCLSCLFLTRCLVFYLHYVWYQLIEPAMCLHHIMGMLIDLSQKDFLLHASSIRIRHKALAFSGHATFSMSLK